MIEVCGDWVYLGERPSPRERTRAVAGSMFRFGVAYVLQIN